MLRNVGHPQLIWCQPVELAVHQMIGGHYAAQPFDPDRTGQTINAGERHQDRHRAWADCDPHAKSEFGVDAAIAVGAPRGDVDLTDQSGQSLPAQLLLWSVFACACSNSAGSHRE